MIDLSQLTPCPMWQIPEDFPCGHVCNAFCTSDTHFTLCYAPLGTTAAILSDILQTAYWKGTHIVITQVSPVSEAPDWEDQPDKDLWRSTLGIEPCLSSDYSTKWLIGFTGCPQDCPRILASQGDSHD